MTCDYSECSRRETCKTDDFGNCPIYQYYDFQRDLIDTENQVFIREERRCLRKLFQDGDYVRGRKL